MPRSTTAARCAGSGTGKSIDAAFEHALGGAGHGAVRCDRDRRGRHRRAEQARREPALLVGHIAVAALTGALHYYLFARGSVVDEIRALMD
jgi:hypothetical protein